MPRSTLALSLCGLVAAASSAEKHWAVLIAGSNGFDNYRHQADVCHAYQVLMARGFNPKRVITMMVDDVAHDTQNPFPGKLYNYPWKTMEEAKDVYAGCVIDYKGKDVNPKKFLAVLQGDADAAGGKVLQSTDQDHVFVNFVDHGGVGLIAFPDGQQVLHAKALNKALKDMHKKKMFKQLTFYLETCESGSMFDKILPHKGLPVYAVTAANAKESSWGTYCGTDAKVAGKSLNTCLGDLFSVNWMEDSDVKKSNETLDFQFNNVRTVTKKSHVMRFGEWHTFGREGVADFQNGDGQAHHSNVAVSPAVQARRESQESSSVSARDATLNYLYHKYMAENTPEAEAALKKEMDERRAVKDLEAALSPPLLAVTRDVYGRPEEDEVNWTPELLECHFRATEAFGATCGWSESRLPLSKALYKLCHRSGSDHGAALAAIHAQCAVKDTDIVV